MEKCEIEIFVFFLFLNIFLYDLARDIYNNLQDLLKFKLYKLRKFSYIFILYISVDFNRSILDIFLPLNFPPGMARPQLK